MSTKMCRTCGETKPIECFYQRGVSGQMTACKSCHNQRTIENREARKARDPERVGAMEWAAQHRYRLKRYGLTPATFKKMALDQGRRCAICRQVRELHVDHDHTTGRVRGLLCRECNLGIGKLGDSLKRLQAAVAYLAR